MRKYFTTEEIADKMNKEAEQNKEIFKGFDLLKKILDINKFNMSVAPLPNGQKNISLNFLKSQLSTNVGKSKFKESDIHVEYSANFDEERPINDKKKSRYESQMPIINEEKYKIKYKCVQTIKENNEIVSLIQLKSGLIAVGDCDSNICIWNIKEESCYKRLQDDATVFCLLEFKEKWLLSGTINNIGLWDLNLEKPEKIKMFEGHENLVNCLVKCNNNIFASCSKDKTIRIWDYDKGKEFNKIDDAHNGNILCLIILKNGNLCSGGADSLIKIWDLYNGLFLNQIKGHENCVNCLCQLNDETLISGSSDRTIKIWKNYKEWETLYEHQKPIIYLCAIDEDHFISSSDKTIQIWNIKNKKCCQTLLGHESDIPCVIISNDNNALISCSNDKTIKIWEKA